MQNFADAVRSYAEECANSACDWPLRSEVASDLFVKTMNRASTPPADLSRKQIDLIHQAILLGAVAGRPRMDPVAVQYCRGILLQVQETAQNQELATLLEECFEIGYRAASIR
jgi:hypothetical protein